MRTIMVNHLRCSTSRRSLLGFGKTMIVDYETSQGIVREYSGRNMLPKYKLVRSMLTREPVNIELV